MTTLDSTLNVSCQKLNFYNSIKTKLSIKYEKVSASSNDKIIDNSNYLMDSSKVKTKKEISNDLKVLHNQIESNYVNLLKNLSKILIKPKDIFRKNAIKAQPSIDTKFSNFK